MGSFLAYVFLVVFLILLTLWFLRVVLWAIGFGRWACSKGWHWYKTFPLHKHYGLTERTTTYLAVAGRKIHQCRTCGDFNPPEGKVVHEQWTRGGVASVGGTIFSGPKMEMDREAARRIGATLARTAAATPLSKPEKAPPRWMVVLGSTAIVQALGIYLVLAAGCAAMISLVGAITSEEWGVCRVARVGRGSERLRMVRRKACGRWQLPAHQPLPRRRGHKRSAQLLRASGEDRARTRHGDAGGCEARGTGGVRPSPSGEGVRCRSESAVTGQEDAAALLVAGWEAARYHGLRLQRPGAAGSRPPACRPPDGFYGRGSHLSGTGLFR